jgi:hypothetical protein
VALCGLVDLALQRLGVRVRPFDEVGERLQRRGGGRVERDVGEGLGQPVVELVVRPLGPRPGPGDAFECRVDGRLVGVRRDVAGAARHLDAEFAVVGHPQDGREGVRDPDRSVVGRLPDDHRVGAVGALGRHLVGLAVAVVDGLEAVELLDQPVDRVDVEVPLLRGVLREEVPDHRELQELQDLLDGDDGAGRRRERLARQREPLVDHRDRRRPVEHLAGDGLAGRPGALGVVLAERLDVDAEGGPLGGPLEPPGELPLPERRRPGVAAALDHVIARRDVLADVRDGLRLEVDVGDGLGEVAAHLTAGEEGDVVVVDRVLEPGEHRTDPLAALEDVVDLGVELAAVVQVGGGDDVDGDVEGVGGPLEQCREVGAVAVTAAERVGHVRVGPAEVPSEGAGVDRLEADDVPLEVRQGPGQRPQPVAVVGREDLADLPAAVPERLGDVVAAHHLVDVAEVRDAGRRDAALDDDGVCGVAREDLVGDGVGPEGPPRSGPDLVGVSHRGPRRCRRRRRRRRP